MANELQAISRELDGILANERAAAIELDRRFAEEHGAIEKLFQSAVYSRPDLIVTFTGLLERLGAAGLLVASIAPAASACLAALLIAVFPANLHAARQNLTLGRLYVLDTEH